MQSDGEFCEPTAITQRICDSVIEGRHGATATWPCWPIRGGKASQLQISQDFEGSIQAMTESETERRRKVGEERRERMRQRLLAAAARVLAEQGEGNASINDFIKAAGVARGTFYNYYTTRDQIIEDLWEQFGARPFVEIHYQTRSYGDPAERLSVGCRLALERASTDSTWGWIAYASSLDAGKTKYELTRFPAPDLLIGRETGRFQFDNFESICDLIQGSMLMALRGLLLGTRTRDCISPLMALILRSLGLGHGEALEIAGMSLPEVNKPD